MSTVTAYHARRSIRNKRYATSLRATPLMICLTCFYPSKKSQVPGTEYFLVVFLPIISERPTKVESTLNMPQRHLPLLLFISFMSSSVTRALLPSFAARRVCCGSQLITTAPTRLFSEKTSPSPISRDTGGLRRLPVVKSPDELANRAIKVKRTINANGYVHY